MEIYLVTYNLASKSLLDEVKKNFGTEEVGVIFYGNHETPADFIEEIQACCSENSVFVTNGCPKTVATLTATLSEMNELSEDTGADMANTLHYVYEFDTGVRFEKIYPPC